MCTSTFCGVNLEAWEDWVMPRHVHVGGKDCHPTDKCDKWKYQRYICVWSVLQHKLGGWGKRIICGSWFSYYQESPEIKPRSWGMAACAFIYPAGSPAPQCLSLPEASSSRGIPSALQRYYFPSVKEVLYKCWRCLPLLCSKRLCQPCIYSSTRTSKFFKTQETQLRSGATLHRDHIHTRQ